MRYTIDENAIQTSALREETKPALPPNLIIAVFSPGFNVKLHCWRLTISESGRLAQTINVNERWLEGGRVHEIKEKREQEAEISTEFVKELLAQAIAIIDKPFIPHSGEMFTDGPVRTLTARIEGIFLDVPDYEFTDDYRKLWEDVHRFAPHNPWRDSTFLCAQ